MTAKKKTRDSCRDQCADQSPRHGIAAAQPRRACVAAIISRASTATGRRNCTTWCCARSRSRCSARCSITPPATRAAPRGSSASIAARCARSCSSWTWRLRGAASSDGAGQHPGLLRAAMPLPVRRALLSVSDKTGLLELARAARGARHRAALDRRHRAPAGRRRHRRYARSPTTPAFPKSWTGASRRCTRRFTAACSAGAAPTMRSCSSTASSRSTCWWSTSTHSPRRSRGPDCSYDEADREHRHRRSGDAARRGQEPRRRHGAGRSGGLRRRARGDRRAQGAATSIDTRSRLAAKAFAHTARYDTMVASYLQRRGSGCADERFPAAAAAAASRRCRTCATARTRTSAPPSTATRPPAALAWPARACCRARTCPTTTSPMPTPRSSACASSPRPPASSSSTPIPAGSRSRPISLEAYERAYRTDPTSAFGGIIAFNRELDAATARAIIERQFVEVLVAPARARRGRARCSPPRANVRVLALGELACATPAIELEFRSVTGGLLVQERDLARPDARGSEGGHAAASPTARELADLLFAWRVCKFVKSNAIVFARDDATLGIGAGQMSRVYSTRDRGPEGRGREARRRAEPSWPRMRSCRSATASMSPPATASGGHPARRQRARCGGDRRGRRARHGDGVHRHAALPALSATR